MVLVATVALGSSTYAWFANNSQVTATGMAVNAQSEGGIEIATVSGSITGTYGTVASAEMTSVSLLPTSTDNTTRWVHASAAITTNKAAIADTYAELTTTVNNDIGSVGDKNYYVVKTFNIRSTSNVLTASALKIDEVKVTNNNPQNLSKALRIAVVVGNTNPIFYAPAGGDSTTQVWASNSTVDGVTTPTYNTAITNNDGNSQLASNYTSTIDYENGVNAKIYIYFEGEDTELKSENIQQTLETLNVSVKFSATVA